MRLCLAELRQKQRNKKVLHLPSCPRLCFFVEDQTMNIKTSIEEETERLIIAISRLLESPPSVQ